MNLFLLNALSQIETTSEAVSEAVDTMGNTIKALKVMGLGMAGIFVVMMLIYLVIVILNKVTKVKEDGEE